MVDDDSSNLHSVMEGLSKQGEPVEVKLICDKADPEQEAAEDKAEEDTVTRGSGTIKNMSRGKPVGEISKQREPVGEIINQGEPVGEISTAHRSKVHSSKRESVKSFVIMEDASYNEQSTNGVQKEVAVGEHIAIRRAALFATSPEEVDEREPAEVDPGRAVEMSAKKAAEVNPGRAAEGSVKKAAEVNPDRAVEMSAKKAN